MSLLENAFEKCTMKIKTIADDGYGGQKETWADGNEIECAIVYDTSVSTAIAQANGSNNAYKVITNKDIMFKYNDVIQRLNGQILRVTTNGVDNNTPSIAMLNMRVVSAENWEIPA